MYGNFIDEDKFLKYLHTNGSPNAFWNGCSKKEVKELIFLMNSFIMIYPKCSEVFSMEAIMGKQFGNIVTLRSIYFSEEGPSIILEKYAVSCKERKEYIIKEFSYFTTFWACDKDDLVRPKMAEADKYILNSITSVIIMAAYTLIYLVIDSKSLTIPYSIGIAVMFAIMIYGILKYLDCSIEISSIKKKIVIYSDYNLLRKRAGILESLKWEELMNPSTLYKNERNLYMEFFASNMNMKCGEFIKEIYGEKGFDNVKLATSFLKHIRFNNLTINDPFAKMITIHYPDEYRFQEEPVEIKPRKDSVQEIPDIKEESLDDSFTKGLQSVMKNIEDLDLYNFSEKKPFQEIAKFTRMIYGQMKEMKGEISSISDEDKIRLTNYYFKETITILDIIENNLRILNRGKVGLSTNEQKRTIQSSKEALETLCDVYSVVLNKRTIEEYDTLDVITTVLREKVEMDGFTKNGGEDA